VNNNVATGSESQRLSSANNGTSNHAAVEDDSAWVGRHLGRFEITEVLGKGAMGVVFKAHDPDLKRDVALKILAKQFIRSQKKTYRLEQFVREARSAARLSHPHTVTVFEIGQDQGWFFIAMELVEGKTLLDLVIKKRKKVPVEQACELVAEAADALSAAHRLGVIHRDIKPSNLMLTLEGRVKVADFGLAQLEDTEDDFELPTKAVGTPYWMSPEQCKGETAIPQSDIYSLGAVLYFALTGEVPFKGKTKREILDQHMSAPVPDPRRIRKDIPESIVKIIQRAMAKNPKERFRDAGEMAIGLRQAANLVVQSKMAERWWGQLASHGSIPSTLGNQPKQSTPLLRWLSMIAVLLVLIFGVGSMVFWYVKHPGKNPVDLPGLRNSDGSEAVKVPVYVVPGRLIYHAKGCPLLKDVPADKLIEFPSDKDAEAVGDVGCKYCQHLLILQKEAATSQQTTK
jgi:serine/threonine protein kinase